MVKGGGNVGKQYRHLSYDDRLQLEVLNRAKHTVKEISGLLGFSVATINRELNRGAYVHRNPNWTEEIRYSPQLAEEKYRKYLSKKGRKKKISQDTELLTIIERKIIEDKYSPYAALQAIQQENEYQGDIWICLSTCYNYIRDGEFPNLELSDLPYKRRKGKKKKRVRKRAMAGTSIERRPSVVDTREEFGHWEMDTVVGKQGSSKKSLLVLSERKTRYELIILLARHTMEEVVKSLDRIERKFGEKTFREIFKTVTVDNGSEFSDFEGMERSRRNKRKRTSLFYCHPYTSCERATNENQNKLIRRHIPKGSNFDDKTQGDISKIQDWMNRYPRDLFQGKSSEDLYQYELEKLWKNSA